ncbi:MAG: hypothetical protein AABZ06_05250 [Bdellovibrionota bacterium]
MNNHNKPVILIGVLCLLVGLFSGSGCKPRLGKAKFEPPRMDPNACMWQGQYLKGALAKRCCSGGVVKSPAPDECPARNVAETTIKSTMKLFGASAGSAKNALSEADKLEGNAPTFKNGLASAATAQQSEKGLIEPHKKPDGKQELVKLGDASAKKDVSGFLLGSPRFSSQGLDMGGGTTSAVPSATPSMSVGSTDEASDTSSTYSSSGGSGEYQSSSSEDEASIADGGTGEGNTVVDEFDRKPASADKEDELDENENWLLKPGSNIFKIVEKRYRKKSNEWAKLGY